MNKMVRRVFSLVLSGILFCSPFGAWADTGAGKNLTGAAGFSGVGAAGVWGSSDQFALELEYELRNQESCYSAQYIVKEKAVAVPGRLSLSEPVLTLPASGLSEAAAEAFEAALPAKEQARSELLERVFQEAGRLDAVPAQDGINAEASAVLERLDAENSSVPDESLPSEPTVTAWREGYQLITLPEAVDPELFMSRLMETSGLEMEYIQPDYELELADAAEETGEEINIGLEIRPSGESEAGSPAQQTEEEAAGAAETPGAPAQPPATASAGPDKPAQSPEAAPEEPEAPSPEPGESEEPEPAASSAPPDGAEASEEPAPPLPEDGDLAVSESAGSGVTVAVIDTGIDVTHPDLESRILGGWDFVSDSAPSYEPGNEGESLHGTHVAGIIAQTAPGAAIMPLRVFSGGRAYTSDIIDAIEYAAENGARIVNCSFGSADDNRALREAIAASGLLFVCAAGNNRQDVDETPVYPACFDLGNIISVTALNADFGFSYFSNYGPSSVDIAAPGRDIVSARPGGGTAEMSGSSMSAGFVSGAAAAAAELEAGESGGDEETFDAAKLEDALGAALETPDASDDSTKTDAPAVDDETTRESDAPDSGFTHPDAADSTVDGTANDTEVTEDETAALPQTGVDVSSGAAAFFDPTAGRLQLGIGTGLRGRAEDSAFAGGKTLAGTLAHPAVQGDAGPAFSDSDVSESVSRHFMGTAAPTAMHSVFSAAVKARVLDTADRYSHLTQKVAEGRSLSLENLAAGTAVEDVTMLDPAPAEDFDVHSYQPTPDENWELFNSVENIQISGGNEFVIALKSDGSVWAWGENKGRLGDGEYFDRGTPKPVPGLTKIISIAAGFHHAVALHENGTLYAWGMNDYGKLGDGTTTSRSVPVPVAGISGVTQISAGLDHTVALTENDTVYTWGRNNMGQLGNGNTTNLSTPSLLTSIGFVKSIEAGRNHTVAVKTDGTVYAWGENGKGQLGDNTTVNKNLPTFVAGLSNVKSVSAGFEHTLAVTEDGAVYAWGYNNKGQLGIMSHTTKLVPTLTMVVSDVTAVCARGENSAALQSDGKLYTWGENGRGQLGINTTTNTFIPVLAMENVRAMGLGSYNTYAIDEMGILFGWGSNLRGQLGLERSMEKNSAQLVMSGAKQVSAGKYSSGVLDAEGIMYACGYNYYGQLGDGGGLDNPALHMIPGLTGIEKLEEGYQHSFAIKSDGSLYAWGYNYYGQVGDGTRTTRKTPVLLTGISNVQEVSSGEQHSLAITDDGTLYAWGDNTYGQLGNGTSGGYSTTPTVVTGISNVKFIATGYRSSYAVTEDGTLYAWGDNSSGQLGDGTKTSRTSPTKITGISNVQKVSSNKNHTLAIQEDGTLYAWGANKTSQLGNGTTTDHYTPGVVPGIGKVKAISNGHHHSAAVGIDGKVYVWGDNTWFETGDGKNKREPTLMPGIENAVDIDCGFAHNICLTEEGDVYTWGYDYNGQLGIEIPLISKVPYKISGSINDLPDTPLELGKSNLVTIEPGEQKMFSVEGVSHKVLEIAIGEGSFYGGVTITILDSSGKVLKSGSVYSGNKKIMADLEQNGTHYIRITNGGYDNAQFSFTSTLKNKIELVELQRDNTYFYTVVVNNAENMKNATLAFLYDKDALQFHYTYLYQYSPHHGMKPIASKEMDNATVFCYDMEDDFAQYRPNESINVGSVSFTKKADIPVDPIILSGESFVGNYDNTKDYLGADTPYYLSPEAPAAENTFEAPQNGLYFHYMTEEEMQEQAAQTVLSEESVVSDTISATITSSVLENTSSYKAWENNSSNSEITGVARIPSGSNMRPELIKLTITEADTVETTNPVSRSVMADPIGRFTFPDVRPDVDYIFGVSYEGEIPEPLSWEKEIFSSVDKNIGSVAENETLFIQDVGYFYQFEFNNTPQNAEAYFALLADEDITKENILYNTVPITTLTTNEELNIDSNRYVDAFDLSSSITAGTWFDDPFDPGAADINGYSAVVDSHTIPDQIPMNQTGTFEITFTDTSTKRILEDQMRLFSYQWYYALNMKVFYPWGESANMAEMFECTKTTFTEVSGGINVTFTIQYNLTTPTPFIINARLANQTSNTDGFGESCIQVVNGTNLYLTNLHYITKPTLGSDNHLLTTVSRLEALPSSKTYTAKVYANWPGATPYLKKTVNFTFPAGDLEYWLDLGNITLDSLDQKLTTTVEIYDGTRLVGKGGTSNILYANFGVAPSDMYRIKKPGGSMLYVNNPEKLSDYDVIRPEKRGSGANYVLFQQANVNGVNTLYATHSANGNNAIFEDAKLRGGFYYDIDFYNPSTSSVSVWVTKQPVAFSVSVYDDLSKNEDWLWEAEADHVMTIPPGEHRLFFRDLMEQDALWTGTRNGVNETFYLGLYANFVVEGGKNVTVSTLAAYDQQNLRLFGSPENLRAGSENGIAISQGEMRFSSPSETDLHQKMKGIDRGLNGEVISELSYVFNDATPNNIPVPLQVNFKGEGFYGNLGPKSPQSEWYTNVNPINDKYIARYSTPVSGLEDYSYQDGYGQWSFNFKRLNALALDFVPKPDWFTSDDQAWLNSWKGQTTGGYVNPLLSEPILQYYQQAGILGSAAVKPDEIQYEEGSWQETLWDNAVVNCSSWGVKQTFEITLENAGTKDNTFWYNLKTPGVVSYRYKVTDEYGNIVNNNGREWFEIGSNIHKAHLKLLGYGVLIPAGRTYKVTMTVLCGVNETGFIHTIGLGHNPLLPY